ncbi:MAG: flippase-like domain-containing protein [Hyphomicrobiales bacterium]|nr:flippase-like domain-containing protein [Hyphomicrobiales bacterium]
MNGYLVFAAKVLLTVVFLWFAFQTVELGRIDEALYRISAVPVIAAILAVLLQSMLLALRWRLIAIATGEALPLGAAVNATLVSFLFSQGLPASVGADVFRVWWMRKFGTPIGRATEVVLLDRFAGLVFLVLLATLGTLVLALGWQANWAIVVAVAATAGALIMLLAVLLVGESVVRPVVRFLHLDRVGLFLKLLDVGRRLRGHILNLLAVPRHACAFAALSLAIHLLTVAICYNFAVALDARVSFAQCFAVLPIGLLLSYLPISIAGWGVRELSFVGGLALVGVSNDVALVSALALGLTVLCVSLIGAALWILGGIREQFLATAGQASRKEIER